MKLNELFEDASNTIQSNPVSTNWWEEEGKRKPRFPGDSGDIDTQPAVDKSAPPASLQAIFDELGIKAWPNQWSVRSYNDVQDAKIKNAVARIKEVATDAKVIDQNRPAVPGQAPMIQDSPYKIDYILPDGHALVASDGALNSLTISWKPIDTRQVIAPVKQ